MPKNRVHKQSDGRYTYSATDKAGNVHSLKSRKGEREGDFKKRCDDLDRLMLGEVRTDTFDGLFNLWRNNHLEPNCSNADATTTVQLYDRHVRPYLGLKRLSDIDRATVYHVLMQANKRGLASGTIKRIRGCVSRPYNWAVDTLGMRLMIPTQGMRFKYNDQRQDERKRTFTDKELDRFFAVATESKYVDCFRLMLGLGLRPSEALGLQIRDIDLEHKQLHIQRAVTHRDMSDGKTTQARRTIPLPDDLVRMLARIKSEAAFKTPDGWLFPTESGDPDMSALTSAFKRIIAKTAVHELGGRNGMKKLRLIKPAIKASPYDFRHTFATRMAEAGMQPVMLKSILGHKDIKVTLTYYVHVTEEMQSAAKELISNKFGTKFGTNF